MTPNTIKPLPLYIYLILLIQITLTNGAAIQIRTILTPRQTPTPTPITPPPSLIMSCPEYSRVANLSTIASNTTLRGAFLRSSSLGTFAAAHILDVEKPKLASIKFDKDLNQQCGNLSELAIVEADRNLTNGVVAGMRLLDAPGVAPDNLAMPILAVLFVVLMGVPASAL
ncbi:hypothetical protein GGS20DRAFT_128348 [Poronia punctata]|nr:hypothetical protein GGS20DRAFT_128348 [Poronia punctata]